MLIIHCNMQPFKVLISKLILFIRWNLLQCLPQLEPRDPYNFSWTINTKKNRNHCSYCQVMEFILIVYLTKTQNVINAKMFLEKLNVNSLKCQCLHLTVVIPARYWSRDGSVMVVNSGTMWQVREFINLFLHFWLMDTIK